MAVTAAQMKTRYPQLGGLTDPQIEEFIDDAELVIVAETWGDLRDRAVKLYAAHSLTLNYREQLGLGAKLKELETGKPIPVNGNSGEEWFSLTSYGCEYLQLKSEGLGIIAFNMY